MIIKDINDCIQFAQNMPLYTEGKYRVAFHTPDGLCCFEHLQPSIWRVYVMFDKFDRVLEIYYDLSGFKDCVYSLREYINKGILLS